MLFTADIVGAARATEDPHTICLSEPLAPIMKFPTRVVSISRSETNLLKLSTVLRIGLLYLYQIIRDSVFSK